jgi:hypothetical protein
MSYDKPEIIEGVGQHVLGELCDKFPQHEFVGGQPAGRVENLYRIGVRYDIGWRGDVWPSIEVIRKIATAHNKKTSSYRMRKARIRKDLAPFKRKLSSALKLEEPESIARAIEIFGEYVEDDIKNSIPSRKYYLNAHRH